MCLPIIAGVLSGIGSFMGAMAQAESSRAQAEFEERQAKIEREAGVYKAERQQDQIDRVQGQQRADLLSSGIALSGTPGGVIEESAEEGAMDIAAIRWNTTLASDNLQYKAKISRMNAANAAAAAPIGLLTPIIGGINQQAQQAALNGKFGG